MMTLARGTHNSRLWTRIHVILKLIFFICSNENNPRQSPVRRMRVLRFGIDFEYHFASILGPRAILKPSWSHLGTPRVKAYTPRPHFVRIWLQMGPPMETQKSPLKRQADYLSIPTRTWEGSFSRPAFGTHFGTPTNSKKDTFLRVPHMAET